MTSGARVEEEISEQEGGTHADEMETSMMLYIKPEIVDMDRAVKEYDPTDAPGLTRNPTRRGEAKFSASGVYGDATLATVEKGRLAVEARVRHIVDELRAFIDE
jgi:creatinine amidohydrolase